LTAPRFAVACDCLSFRIERMMTIEDVMSDEKVTPRLKMAVSRAVDLARQYGHVEVTDPHLLAALIWQTDGTAGSVLADLGMKVEHVNEYLALVPRFRGADEMKAIPFSKDAANIFGIALHVKFPGRESDTYIGTEHLLLAILKHSEFAVKLLSDHGVTGDKVENGVEEILGIRKPDSVVKEIERLTASVDAFSAIIKNPGLHRIVRQLTDERNGLMQLVTELSGQLHNARQTAEVEKQRGDKTLERCLTLGAQMANMQKEIDGLKAKKLNNVREEARRAMGVVSRWIEFVSYRTTYLKDHPGWPTFADYTHSSLLFRMLQGQEPLPPDEYEKAKREGKV
jgi:ATP-dependent Clp protease ATP-binding subunit ClpA